MSENFEVELVTLGRKVASLKAEEVVLPAYDGECGVLADHRDFIGRLGCGVLRIESASSTKYLVVDSGIWRVLSGKLLLFAKEVVEPKDIDLKETVAEMEELESIFSDQARFSPGDFPAQSARYKKLKAKKAVCQMTS